MKAALARRQFVPGVALVLLLLLPSMAVAQVDVWIDTDPSIGMRFRDADDGFALIQAFGSPELRIRGISVTYGNASLREEMPIAQELAARFGKDTGIGAKDVFAGAGGAEDLGRATAATDALAKALSAGRLTYVALGPLTNLATLLAVHPKLVGQIDRVVFLGGRAAGERLFLGSRVPYEFHDANFEKDPLAAMKVLRAPVALELVPISASKHVLLTPADLARIGRDGGDAGKFLRRAAADWLCSWQCVFGLEGGPVFDSMAVLAVAHPELFAGRESTVCVSTELGQPASAGLADPKQKHYLLVGADAKAATTPIMRKAFVHATVKEGAKEQLIEELIGRKASTPPPQAGR